MSRVLNLKLELRLTERWRQKEEKKVPEASTH